MISDNRTIHASSRTKLRREDSSTHSEDDLSGEEGTDGEEDCDDDSEEEEACDGHVSSDGSHVTGKASTTHTVERSPEKQKSNRVRVRARVTVYIHVFMSVNVVVCSVWCVVCGVCECDWGR